MILSHKFLFYVIWFFNFFYFFHIFKKCFIYLFLRERQSSSRGEGQREIEGDRESDAGSRLQAVSTEPNTGLKLTNSEIMTWAEVGHLTDWATQTPLFHVTLVLPLSVFFYYSIQNYKRVFYREKVSRFDEVPAI